jgi:hypothetical protein
MRFHYKKEFIKQFDVYSRQEQDLILEADRQIKDYVKDQNAPYGLRIKNIGKNVFEARVSKQIRIVWVKQEDMITFALIGSHDEVRRFIKRS